MDPVSIIGLALAVYPILSHAFTQYKEGAEYFQNWKRYRTRFEGFTREIDGQSYLFENVIRGLVFEGPRPISSKDVTEDTFLNRLRDKNDPIWSTDVLLETVKIRLGHRFSWFMDTIQQVYGILEELSKTLEISELENSDHTAQRWEFQWKRIRDTLNLGFREKKLEELRKLVEDLEKALAAIDKRLEGKEYKNVSLFAQLFRGVRENAHCLYTALKSGWRCSCTISHTILLQLDNTLRDQPTQATGVRFELLFLLPSQQNESHNASVQLQTGQEVEVKVSAYTDVPTVHPGVPAIRKQEEASRSPAPQPMDSVTPKQEEESHLSGQGVTKETKGFKKFFTSIRTVTKSNSLLRPRNNLKRASSIKSAKSQSDDGNSTQASSITQVQSGTSLQNSQTQQAEADVVSIRPETEPDPSLNPIVDICSIVQKPVQPESCFGYLLDEKNRRYQFFAKSRTEITRSKHLISLEDVLNRKDGVQFSRQHRMTVASILTNSLLELSQTRWLNRNWSKDDIYFLRPGGGRQIMFHRPYIIQDFQSHSQAIAATPVESQNMPQDTLLKTFLECLGIILIELCFGTTIEQIPMKALVTSIDASKESNHAYWISIARSIEWEEINGEEPVFSDPVDFCLRPLNIGKVRTGKYNEFLADMFLTVTKPLQDETLLKWPESFKGNHGYDSYHYS